MSNELRFNLNCDKRPEWLDSDNKQLLGDVALTATCDKNWIYHANGEVWGRCVLRPLTESSSSGT